MNWTGEFTQVSCSGESRVSVLNINVCVCVCVCAVCSNGFLSEHLIQSVLLFKFIKVQTGECNYFWGNTGSDFKTNQGGRNFPLIRLYSNSFVIRSDLLNFHIFRSSCEWEVPMTQRFIWRLWNVPVTAAARAQTEEAAGKLLRFV